MAGSEFPFEDGYIITAAGQNNAHYTGIVIHRVDTSTDLNLNVTGVTTTNIDKDYVFTSEQASKLGDYLIIEILGYFNVRAYAGSSTVGYGRINAVIANTTRSVDYINRTILDTTASATTSDADYQDNQINIFKCICPITQDDKDDGFTLNIKLTGISTRASLTLAAFTNNAIIFSSAKSL
jgi:hypothetical protein